jgi:hypothetical protein
MLDKGAHACAHTHKYVIIVPFPWQHWLRERASMLRYTYVGCLVTFLDASLLFPRAAFVGLFLAASFVTHCGCVV